MSNVQKTPLSRSLPAAINKLSTDQIAQLGLAIPGTVVGALGAIVTVNFEVSGLTLQNATMPVASPAYIRLPIQPGDTGIAVPASFYLGGISGLGGGATDATLRGNMSTLFWVPLGATSFPTIPNPDQLVLMGPAGVVLQTADGSTSLTVSEDGVTVSDLDTYELTAATSLSFTVAGHTFQITSAGIFLDGILFADHQHTLVTTGTSNSGPVAP